MIKENDMAKELKKVDVVAVGVGFAGGIALAECAKAGLSVEIGRASCRERV